MLSILPLAVPLVLSMAVADGDNESRSVASNAAVADTHSSGESALCDDAGGGCASFVIW